MRGSLRPRCPVRPEAGSVTWTSIVVGDGWRKGPAPKGSRAETVRIEMHDDLARPDRIVPIHLRVAHQNLTVRTDCNVAEVAEQAVWRTWRHRCGTRKSSDLAKPVRPVLRPTTIILKRRRAPLPRQPDAVAGLPSGPGPRPQLEG